MIYIEPCGGLGNRMRAIDSAIQLARFKNTELIIFWKINEELGASFEELFESFSPQSGVQKVINVAQPNYLDEPYDRYFTKFRKFIKPDIIDNPDWEYEQISHEYRSIFLQLPNGRNHYNKDFETYVKATWKERWPARDYYIRSYSRFYGNPQSNYHFFRPIFTIREKAFSLVNKCGSFSCGIHIRRTDQHTAIEVSTNDKYLELIHQELDQNISTKFLLATDSAKEKNFILSEFGDKIITANAAAGRSTVGAMKDALTELYALAHMRKIIGSYSSSFTETAISYINIKPYLIAL